MDQTARDELYKRVQSLAELASKLEASVKPKLPEALDRWRAELQELTKQRNLVDALLWERRSSTLSEFFSAVGEGVLQAQAKLDATAAADVTRRLNAEEEAAREPEGEDVFNDPPAGASALPVGPPTLFRIPRVTAEIKYSLETLQGKELQLIFYSKASQAKEAHEQRVEFEVVATPVPVDYLQAVRATRAKWAGRGGPARTPRPRGGLPSRAPRQHDAGTEGLESAHAGTEGIEHAHAGTEGLEHAHAGTEGIEHAHAGTEGLEHAPVRPRDPFTAALATDAERAIAVARLRAEAEAGRRRRTPAVPAKLIPHLAQVLVLREAPAARAAAGAPPEAPGAGLATRLYAVLALEGKRRALSVWQITPRNGRVVPLFALPASRAARARYSPVRRALARLCAAAAERQA